MVGVEAVHELPQSPINNKNIAVHELSQNTINIEM
jgi:hypothetical protein